MAPAPQEVSKIPRRPGSYKDIQRPPERVNERIRAPQILVIDDDGAKLGVKTPYEALQLARAKGLDLVEISANARPPVCRIMDYGKHRYRQSKKAAEAKKRQHQATVKEIKFRPSVDEHDYQFKKKHVLRFLQHGDKVKLVVMFRGRERAHREIGQQILERVCEEVSEFGMVEASPRNNGPHLQMVLAPKSTKSKGSGRKPAPPPDRKANTE